MSQNIEEMRQIVERLKSRIDSTSEPHAMYKLQKTISELERKILIIEGKRKRVT